MKNKTEYIMWKICYVLVYHDKLWMQPLAQAGMAMHTYVK